MDNNRIDSKTKHKTAKSWLIFVLLIAFIYNGISFLNTEGNTHPLLSKLFNMIIIVLIIVIKNHEKELDEGNSEIFRQTKLDKYFNIK